MTPCVSMVPGEKGVLSRIKWRIVFTALGALGMVIMYGLNINLSIAIVAMVNHTEIKEFHHDVHGPNLSHVGTVCHSAHIDDPHIHKDEEGPLVWSRTEQGLVLGSYFWGYLITQVPGGRFAEMYGGKWVFFGAVAINIVCTLLSPVCAYAGFQYLIAMRMLMGMGGGLTFPAMNVLVARWAPRQERSSISSLVFGGTSLGTVLSIPTSGIIATTLGWENVFYIHGGCACLWCFLWILFVSDDPTKHPMIGSDEKNYICDNRAVKSKSIKDGEQHPVPWKSIFTSRPFWVLSVCHTLNNFGWYMLLVELPSFMAMGLGFSIKQNALLSSIPFLCNWIFSATFSNVMDMLARKNLVTPIFTRKLSVTIASVIPSGCLIGVALSGCDERPIIILMIVACLSYGSMFSGVFSNHVDLASNFAGILMGITNTMATIPGFTVPALVGSLTHNHPGLEAWHTIFYTTSGLLILECLAFLTFGSSDEQPWNVLKEAEYEMS